jgi:hypothetical protein
VISGGRWTTGSRWRRGFNFSTIPAIDEVRSDRRMAYANSTLWISIHSINFAALYIPLRSLSGICMTQSGKEYCRSCSIPASPSLESVRITRSLPDWLRVSSE